MALANLLPADDSLDELDSYMYQTVSFTDSIDFSVHSQVYVLLCIKT